MTPERILSTILALGFLAAPPLALLYGPRPGLVVLIVALGATIALARTARPSLDQARQALLDRWMVINAVLLVAGVVALVLVSI